MRVCVYTCVHNLLIVQDHTCLCSDVTMRVGITDAILWLTTSLRRSTVSTEYVHHTLGRVAEDDTYKKIQCL